MGAGFATFNIGDRIIRPMVGEIIELHAHTARVMTSEVRWHVESFDSADIQGEFMTYNVPYERLVREHASSSAH